MGNDLIPMEEPRAIQQAELFELKPAAMLAKATEMANVLKSVIKEQKLSVKIGEKDHVIIEGWSTLGNMLGVLPREVSVKELTDGGYEATVELYSVRSGKVVGQASSICGMDESRWSKSPRFARRSMSITRATGKAYRLGFSWIMTLAGYSPTPFEEMPEPDNTSERRTIETGKKGTIFTGTEDQKTKLKALLQKEGSFPMDMIDVFFEKMIGKPSTEWKKVAVEAMDGLYK